MTIQRSDITLVELKERLEFLQKHPFHDYWDRMKTRIYLGKEKTPVKIAEEFNAKSSLAEEYKVQVTSDKRIKLSLPRSKFEDNLYIEFYLDFDLFPHWVGRLVVQNLNFVTLKDDDFEYSLDFGGKKKVWGGIDVSRVEIRECMFMRVDKPPILRGVLFDLSAFMEVDFIENKFRGLEVTLLVSDSVKISGEAINISHNILDALIIKYYARGSQIGKPYYCETIIDDNEVYKFLHIDISSKSHGELRFSVSNNTIEALALCYIREEKDDKQEGDLDRFIVEDLELMTLEPRDIWREHALDSAHPGTHRLTMNGGNNITEIYMVGRFPEIVRWGMDERIGDVILERYKGSVKKGKFLESLQLIFLRFGKGAAKEEQDGMSEEKQTISQELAVKMIEANRYIFNFFRQAAIKENKKPLEQVMNYNIALMNQILLKVDNWGWSDKLIMWIGWLLSRHGTSWLLPILWACAAAFTCATIITWTLELGVVGWNSFLAHKTPSALNSHARNYYLFIGSVFSMGLGVLAAGKVLLNVGSITRLTLSKLLLGTVLLTVAISSWILGEWNISEEAQYRTVLVELLHPLERPDRIWGDKSKDIENISRLSFGILGGIFFFYKIFYLICGYEFVRAARRFTIR